MKLNTFKTLLRNSKNIGKVFLLAVLLTVYITGCSSKDEELGVGPVTEIKLASIDKNLVTKGEQIFTSKCSACHKMNERLVGPPLKDITKRRKPEWIMNMILNPQQMTQENAIAKELFATYLIQMTFQDVSHDDARALLEYFRANDEGLSQTSK
ncbi:MAG: cytochrome c [Ignavibacteriae bacterium]|nr:MAG: cytochrome c [Ignavibacteriota bacterium]